MNEVPLSTPFDRNVDGQVTQAKADLARRLSIDPAQVELVSASSVTWPDGSLGCPQPGMMYTQMQVDGLRVQLRASGRVYDYHGGGGRPLFLCERGGG